MVSMLRAKSDGRPVGIQNLCGTYRKRSRVLRLCGAGLYHHRRPRRRHGFQSVFPERGDDRSDDLCALPGEKISGLRSFRHLAGDYRRSQSILRFRQSDRHGRRCGGSRFCSYDRSRMSAVPDLRQRKLSGWHRHSGSKASQQNEYRSSAQRVANYLNVSLNELRMFARITGTKICTIFRCRIW